jgi:hypothetical protein
VRLCLALAWPAAVLADWSGFAGFGAIAELHINADRTTLNLRLSDAGLARLGQGRESRPPEQIAADLLEIRGGDGQPLPARPEGFRHVDGDPQDPAGGAYYEANWSLPAATGPLTLHPRAGLGPNDLGLITLHRGVPVSDLARLDHPLRLTLDPEDPWRSRYDDPALVRRHGEPRSFLYVEPYEVRHEVLIRLADLLPALGSHSANPLAPADRPALQAKIGEYLLARNALTIDGAEDKPQLDRIDFLGFTRTGMAPVAEDGSLDTNAALVGAVIVYLTERPAEALKLHWDLFGPGRERRGVSVIRGQETFDGDLTMTRPDFEWSAEDGLDPLPVAESAEPRVAAWDALGDGELGPLLQSLLHNAYRAFQLRGEESVYDRLAKSLEDPLLEEIYLQQRRAQLRQTQGLGGEGRVERVEVLEAQAASGRGGEREVDARWRAEGEVSHWGHSHKRNNLYAARLTLRQDDTGSWKIAAMRFLDGQRLTPATAP